MTNEKKKDDKTLFITIPIKRTITPAASGDYVLDEIKEKYPTSKISAVTGATISMVALTASEEKMRLEEVELKIGNDTWFPLKMSFKWARKKR